VKSTKLLPAMALYAKLAFLALLAISGTARGRTISKSP